MGGSVSLTTAPGGPQTTQLFLTFTMRTHYFLTHLVLTDNVKNPCYNPLKPYIGKDIGNFVNVITVPQLAYGFFDLARNQPSFPACNFLLILVKAVIAFPTIYLSFSFFYSVFGRCNIFVCQKLQNEKTGIAKHC